MSIQFKFRSSMSFDSVDIDGRPSISVRDLRLKIIRYKNLKICQDFDLILSNSITGEEYIDEKFQIPRGSSVIIKRVPAGTVPSATMFQSQKLESSELSQAIQRGSDHSKNDLVKLEKVAGSIFPAVRNSDFPAELKCSLCNTFFKEAVMIPCCQHSFCEKCIRLVLREKARCPKCSSGKCRVEDLLPNLSLRQAIEHIIESQKVVTGSENALHKYAPDGESGNQVKDDSCAVTVVPAEPEMPHSPSASGIGSNQVMEESFYDSPMRKDGRGRYANHWNFPSGPDEGVADYQGESQPHFPRTHMHDEGDSSIEKSRNLWVDTRGGDGNFLLAGRVKKDKNCYMCGSPCHFIRDCPFASIPNPMLQTGNSMLAAGFPGYASSYWNSIAYSQPRPLAHMYYNSGMAPFNACMVPTTGFAAPPYMPPMHGGVPLPREQYYVKEANSDDYYHYNDRELSEYKFHKERESSISCSEDCFTRRSQRKRLHVDKRRGRTPCTSAGRDKVLYHSDRSNSGVADFPSSSGRQRRESHRHQNRRYTRDSSWDHHQSYDLDRRVDHPVRGSNQKHPNRLSSGLEPDSPVYQLARCKERGSGRDPKPSRHNARYSSTELREDKRKMSSGRDDYYSHKRKRAH